MKDGNNISKKALKNEKKPLRITFGITIGILLLFFRYILPEINPEMRVIALLSGLFLSFLTLLWWGAFSRASKCDRFRNLLIIITSLILFSQFTHQSIKTGMQGMMYFMLAIPLLCIAFITAVVLTRKLPTIAKRSIIISTIILFSGVWTLFRSGGITGYAEVDIKWRWLETSEQKLLSQYNQEPNKIDIPAESVESEIEWAGFRGTNRDGIVNGVEINSDWTTNPPKELWRKNIGPGCASFAAHGSLLFTQEQRGEYELVSCYDIETGEMIWKHEDSTRFWDSHAGAGPRSTPTLYQGKVYTLGATGILNVIDEITGKLVWSRNAAEDTKMTPPGWAFTSSPLIIDSVVIVALSGKVAAYSISEGKQLWFSEDGGESYSSPHLYIKDSVKQVLFTSQKGASSYNPSNGKLIWEHNWEGEAGGRIIQPAITKDNDILLCSGTGKALRRISIERDVAGFIAKEVWTSNEFKPGFNDFVIHQGYVYGYSGQFLACMNVENGKRKWKGKRYGGQLLLALDQNLLVIITEKGELALVKAMPNDYEEIARYKAIDGKTWNHPILVNNKLIVRNTEEMAAFEL